MDLPPLDLVTEAGPLGGTRPTVLNAENAVPVEAFLSGRIAFLGSWWLVGVDLALFGNRREDGEELVAFVAERGKPCLCNDATVGEEFEAVGSRRFSKQIRPWNENVALQDSSLPRTCRNAAPACPAPLPLPPSVVSKTF